MVNAILRSWWTPFLVWWVGLYAAIWIVRCFVLWDLSLPLQTAWQRLMFLVVGAFVGVMALRAKEEEEEEERTKPDTGSTVRRP